MSYLRNQVPGYDVHEIETARDLLKAQQLVHRFYIFNRCDCRQPMLGRMLAEVDHQLDEYQAREKQA